MDTKISSKKDKMMLVILLGIVLVIGGTLYWYFIVGKSNEFAGLTDFTVRSDKYKLNPKFDIEFLASDAVKSLYKVRNIPVKVENKGNKTPFQPFK